MPTWNEAQNLDELLARILAQPLPLDVLVVDDGSPDGTAQRAARWAAREPRVRVLVRKGPRGRGPAGAAGFAHALLSGYAGAVEMDADLSHPPEALPRLIAACRDGADLVLGSRAVPGAHDARRSLARRLLTRGSNAFVRRLLGLPVRDCNAGFRAWTRRALERAAAWHVASRGPAVVQELLLRAHRAGLRIREVPIRFEDRRRGRSKLGPLRLLGVLRAVVALRSSRRAPPPPLSAGAPGSGRSRAGRRAGGGRRPA